MFLSVRCLLQISSYLKEHDFQSGVLSEHSTESKILTETWRKVWWERALGLYTQATVQRLMWLIVTFWSGVWKSWSACQPMLRWVQTYIRGGALYVGLGAHVCDMAAATGPCTDDASLPLRSLYRPHCSVTSSEHTMSETIVPQMTPSQTSAEPNYAPLHHRLSAPSK